MHGAMYIIHGAVYIIHGAIYIERLENDGYWWTWGRCESLGDEPQGTVLSYAHTQRQQALRPLEGARARGMCADGCGGCSAATEPAVAQHRACACACKGGQLQQLPTLCKLLPQADMLVPCPHGTASTSSVPWPPAR